MGYVDDPLPNIVYIAFWIPACVGWLYYASTSTIWWFPDFFFFCIHQVEKTRENFNNGGLYGHAEWVKTIGLTGRNFDSHLGIKVMAL